MKLGPWKKKRWSEIQFITICFLLWSQNYLNLCSLPTSLLAICERCIIFSGCPDIVVLQVTFIKIKNSLILHDTTDRFDDVVEDETYKNHGLGSPVHSYQDP